MPTQDEIFMRQAIDLSRSAVAHGNEPFGAVLVKDGGRPERGSAGGIESVFYRSR